jgi:hypothetical protein
MNIQKAITVLVMATAITGIVSALSSPVPIEARAPEAGSCGLSDTGESASGQAQAGFGKEIGQLVSSRGRAGTVGEDLSSAASNCGENP